MLTPEKYSYKEFDNEKKFPPLENSPPPSRIFSNSPTLIHKYSVPPSEGCQPPEGFHVSNILRILLPYAVII